MAGFPSRPTRDAFGPTFEDASPIKNPKQNIGATFLNLATHQLAGIGLVCPRAVVSCTVSGGAVTVESQSLAWDPNGLIAKVVPSYDGVGTYTFSYAAAYDDESGASIPLIWKGGVALPQTSTPGIGPVTRSGSNVTARLFDAAGVAIDPAEFLMLLW